MELKKYDTKTLVHIIYYENFIKKEPISCKVSSPPVGGLLVLHLLLHTLLCRTEAHKRFRIIHLKCPSSSVLDYNTHSTWCLKQISFLFFWAIFSPSFLLLSVWIIHGRKTNMGVILASPQDWLLVLLQLWSFLLDIRLHFPYKTRRDRQVRVITTEVTANGAFLDT